jgi:hypothetical protein
MLGGLIAKANFNPINAIHARVAGWGTAKDLDARSWKKTEMGQVVAHLVGQIDAFHHACAAYLRVT